MNNVSLRDPTNYESKHDDDDRVYTGNYEGRMRSTSKRSSRRHGDINLKDKASPLITRSVRAKRRHAFLRTYQLSHLNNYSIATTTAESKCGVKLKDAAIKLKSVITSWASAARLSLVRRGCSCGSLSSSSIRLG